ncbi:MAG: S-adenosylmethionine:tRNA ribosyltransferase-isomerase [Porticoccaceae bacterium]|jgi:S-adenosylmethionine:tRNA ribosyltransferase-isomerase
MVLPPLDLTTSCKTGTVSDFKLSDYHYELPASLIAQAPLQKRSDGRLMILHGQDRSHKSVRDLAQFLKPGDHLVFNNTKVIPARLYGQKKSGGKLELMLERLCANGRVLAKIRASKSPKPGSVIELHAPRSASTFAGISHETLDLTVTGRKDDLFELQVKPGCESRLAQFVENHGEIPLPPYIERKPDEKDEERYQTVFAKKPGAVAAPTAGLHFDTALFESLESAGISHSFITLHVGAGTFQPVRVENPDNHVMHAERVSVESDTVVAIEACRGRGGRVIAVGTTCVRALEASAKESGTVQTFAGETRLFLTPGASFKVVDAIFTNFHLPESTLLMLVAAFAGLDETLAAYRDAVEQQYRFFSYGDAMLVWPKVGVRS